MINLTKQSELEIKNDELQVQLKKMEEDLQVYFDIDFDFFSFILFDFCISLRN